jgi:hypothetical protein
MFSLVSGSGVKVSVGQSTHFCALLKHLPDGHVLHCVGKVESQVAQLVSQPGENSATHVLEPLTPVTTIPDGHAVQSFAFYSHDTQLEEHAWQLLVGVKNSEDWQL